MVVSHGTCLKNSLAECGANIMQSGAYRWREFEIYIKYRKAEVKNQHEFMKVHQWHEKNESFRACFSHVTDAMFVPCAIPGISFAKESSHIS